VRVGSDVSVETKVQGDLCSKDLPVAFQSICESLLRMVRRAAEIGVQDFLPVRRIVLFAGRFGSHEN
jgi:hypothetical protein